MKWHTVSPRSCCKWNVSQVNNLIELLSKCQIFSLNLPIKTIITQVFANAEESWFYCEGFSVCVYCRVQEFCHLTFYSFVGIKIFWVFLHICHSFLKMLQHDLLQFL